MSFLVCSKGFAEPPSEQKVHGFLLSKTQDEELLKKKTMKTNDKKLIGRLNKVVKTSTKFLLVLFICYSCDAGNQQKQNQSQNQKLTSYGNAVEIEENTVVNAIEQAKPTIMVLPSDNLLLAYDALKTVSVNGSSFLDRDYGKYLLANKDNKAIISSIQNEFVQMDYPLNDLEQTLKQLQNRQATNMADGVAQDAKTLLLQTASPDIIIEIDYTCKLDALDPNFQKNLTYTTTAFDAYTNKAFSSKTIKVAATNDISSAFAQSYHNNINVIESEIGKYFRDIVTNGREITVRITVSQKANINLSNESINGDTYSDWIMDYMDFHAKKGTYKLQNNTDYELYFVNVRIPVLKPDGTQYSSYTWARELIKAFKSECGVKCSNKVQGLGDVHIMINGL